MRGNRQGLAPTICSFFISSPPVRSGGNALDDFPRERAAAPVVDLRGLGVAVTREVLDGLERDVLRQQVGDDEEPERVRAAASDLIVKWIPH